MAHEHRLDLARLDPETPQLHLIVRTAQELQHPVRPPAHQVPGAVHPVPRSPERIGHEPLRRQPRPAQIATRQPHSGDVELTRHPRRHRLQARIQHVHLRVPDRTTDRRIAGACQRIAHGCAHRCLGRTIGVDHPPTHRPARRQFRRAGLASDHQRLQRQVLRQARHHRRRQRRMRHLLRADQLRQAFPAALRPGQNQRRPRRQARGDLPHHRIKAQRRKLQQPRLRADAQPINLNRREIGNTAVRHHHALRRSGRARRVDHVGAALRIDCHRRRHSRLPRDRRLIAVQAHQAVDAAGLEPRAQSRLRHQHRRKGVRQHEGKAIVRVGRSSGR